MTRSENEPNAPRDEATESTADVIVVPTPDEDARLRALIRAELERQHALPVARRTLEMLAEAGAEPVSGEPGYRIVDRAGETRLRPVPPERAKKGAKPDTPLTLAEFVGELRERHPELFGTAPPEPEPAVAPHDTLQEKVAHAKAAGARFVETQSAFAKSLTRSLAANSAERGRALAAAAGGTVGGLRSRIDMRLKARQTPLPTASSAQNEISPEAVLVSAEGETSAGGSELEVRTETAVDRRAQEAASSGAQEPNEPAQTGGAAASSGAKIGSGSDRWRPYALGLAGVAALAILVIVLRPGSQTGDNAAPEPVAPRPQAEAQPSPVPDAAPKAAAPAAPANPPADPEEQPDEAPTHAPNEIVGVAEVIDTATLRIAGKVVHLFGVEWVRGGQADELTKYLARRQVSCQPAPGSKAHLCSVNGRDLSEVVLFNGGGRASPEAGPELVAAEDHARSERLGVWKR